MIESAENKYFPWFTTLFSVLLIVIYIILAFLSKSLTIDFKFLEWFGAPYAPKIYLGHVYGVVTNNLIHINIYHLLVNLIGLWLFGAFIERRIGWFKMAILGLICSIFGSMLQLTFSNDAGLGIASAIFGFYTYILIASFRDKRFKLRFIYIFGIALFVLLIMMIINNSFFGEKIAIEAKIGGIIWALLMAIFQKEGDIHWKRLLILFVPFALLSCTLIYAPWSSEWQCARGIYFHKQHDILRAEQYYKKAIQLDSENKLAKDNYTLVKIDELSELAYNAHLQGDYTEARRFYFKILALKKNHKWALKNLKELP